MFGLDEHPPGSPPSGFGGVGELVEHAHFLPLASYAMADSSMTGFAFLASAEVGGHFAQQAEMRVEPIRDGFQFLAPGIYLWERTSD